MKFKKSLFLSLLLLLIASNTMSSERNTGNNVIYDGQGEWYTDATIPAVNVFIQGSYVYAEAANRTATKLKQLNGVLRDEYGAEYIRVRDFTHDRFADVAVLTSVGYSGSDRCYAVFEYLPKQQKYKSRSTKTVCLN